METLGATMLFTVGKTCGKMAMFRTTTTCLTASKIKAAQKAEAYLQQTTGFPQPMFSYVLWN
jgi:hypothetical protein